MTSRPSDFHPQLTEVRLRVVASVLLEQLYETEVGLDHQFDDAYTRGSTAFGRQRNAIIALCQSGDQDWLQLTHAGMDVTFTIDGIPCRFFADDVDNPRKPGFWKRNAADMLFPVEPGKPEVFRFIVEKSHGDDDEADVHFVGFDLNQNVVFHWRYGTSTPSIRSVDPSVAKEVDIPPAPLSAPPKAGENAISDSDNDQA